MNRRNVLIGEGAIALARAGGAALNVLQIGSMEEYTASAAATRVVLSERLELKGSHPFRDARGEQPQQPPWQCRLGEDQLEMEPDLSATDRGCGSGRPPSSRQPLLRRRDPG